MNSSSKLLVIAVNNLGHGLSGGDRIWVNLCKQWRKKIDLFLLGVPESFELGKRHQTNFSGIKVDIYNNSGHYQLGNLIRHQIRRVFKCLSYVLSHWTDIKKYQYVLSVSDFYPDLLPALFIKIFHPQTIWIASFYLFAPNPLDQNSPYNQNHQSLKGFFYFLSQIPSRFLTEHFADIVFVTSQPDKSKFNRPRVIIVRGGVNSVNFEKYKQSKSYRDPSKRPYLACYLGRLHVQKGVLQLIDIWQLVTQKIPNAKLALIGNGQLETKIKHEIKLHNLSKNIKMFGFMEGKDKINIFQNSQMILHPATFDSGGMAAAEGLSWGLPGISFDLPALKTYYPQGFIKVPCFDYKKFAKSIIKLSENKTLYQHLSTSGLTLIAESWTWEKQAEKIYQQIFTS